MKGKRSTIIATYVDQKSIITYALVFMLMGFFWLCITCLKNLADWITFTFLWIKYKYFMFCSIMLVLNSSVRFNIQLCEVLVCSSVWFLCIVTKIKKDINIKFSSTTQMCDWWAIINCIWSRLFVYCWFVWLVEGFKLNFVIWSLTICGKNDLGVLLDIIVEIEKECALKYMKMKEVETTQTMVNFFYK